MREVWSLFIQLYMTCVITGDVVCLNNALNGYDTSLSASIWGLEQLHYGETCLI